MSLITPKVIYLSAALVLMTGLSWAAPTIGQTQNFSVAQPSRVPGAILSPGKYSISLLNYMADRSILQVKNASGQVLATFIGIRKASVPPGIHSGLAAWKTTPFPEMAYRGWLAPNGNELFEFAYPKTDAVALATSNHETVPAIDPESEGKVAAPNLSSNDMKVINLWLLSTGAATGAGGETAIQAQRFTPPGSTVNNSAPAAKRLPQTASNLPLYGASGLLLLALSGLLSKRRKPRYANSSRSSSRE